MLAHAKLLKAVLTIACLLVLTCAVAPVQAGDPWHSGGPDGTAEGTGQDDGGDEGNENDGDEDDEGDGSDEDNQSDDTSDDGDDGEDGEPVYLFNGAFTGRQTDLLIPGRLPIEIRREYHSQSLFNGMMGYGWAFNYHLRLFSLADGSMLLKRGDNACDTFTDNGDNTFSPPAGEHDELVLNGNGTYTLTTWHNRRYHFDQDGKLVGISDRRGNQLLFSYNPGGLLPINGISPFSSTQSPILIGYDYRLTRIDEARDDVATGRYVTFDYNDDGRVEAIEDFTGRRVLYAYDQNGNGDLVSVTDPAGNVYTYDYYPGHLISSYSASGCAECTRWTNEYDAEDRVIRQTHGLHIFEFEYLVPGVRGEITAYTYDETTGGLLRTRVTYYDFQEDGRVTKVTHQMGVQLDEDPGSTENDDIVTTYAYYSEGLNVGSLMQKIDPRGAIITYQYDDGGNLTKRKITDPENPNNWWRTSYEYTDPDNAPHQYTARTIEASFDPGNVYRTEYTYWPDGREKDEIRILDETTSYTTASWYHPDGTLQRQRDPCNNELVYEYDQYGFLERVYDPNDPNYQTLYDYDDLGRLRSVTDALGRSTSYEYDALDRVTAITNALNEQTVFTYDHHRLTTAEYGRSANGPGRVFTFEYDDKNRPTQVIAYDDDGLPVTLSTTEYDTENRVLRVTDGNGNTTARTYDVARRLKTLTTALGHTTEYTYDSNGNVISVVDAEQNETRAEYDFLNRRRVFHYSDGTAPYQITYDYNVTGHFTQITDDNGYATVYHRDHLSRTTMVDGWPQDPLKNKTRYEYDGNNNIVRKMTPNEYADQQRWIEYAYDPYNRLERVDYPDGRVVQYGRDLVGNATSWSDGTFAETRVFDALNRFDTRTTHYPGFSKTVSYTYDTLGRIRSMTDGEGRTTWYHRNSLGRLRYIAHPGQLVTEYQFDTGGRLAARILPNHVTSAFTYDDDNRITELIHDGPQGLLQSFGYTYDDVNNRKSMTTLAGTHVYEYDDLYRLTSATHPDPELADESYTYDGVQNRRTSAEHDTWSHDNTNFLTGYGNGGVLEVEFHRDAAGNTTGKTDDTGTTTYQYDFDNHLVGVMTPEHDVAFGYSPSGRRLSKTVDGVTTYFLYDLEDVIAEHDSGGALQRTFLHGRGLDEPVAMIEGAGTFSAGDLDHDGSVGLSDLAVFNGALGGPGRLSACGDLDADGDSDLRDFGMFQLLFGGAGGMPNVLFYLQDAMGSVVALTDGAGSAVETYVYDAFGRSPSLPSASGNPYGFTGRWYDAQSGQYYFRYRYYDSETGRFSRTDPFAFWFVDRTCMMNRYCYVGGNPLSLLDPYGLFCWETFWDTALPTAAGGLAGGYGAVGIAVALGASAAAVASTPILVGIGVGAVVGGAVAGAVAGFMADDSDSAGGTDIDIGDNSVYIEGDNYGDVTINAPSPPPRPTPTPSPTPTPEPTADNYIGGLAPDYTNSPTYSAHGDDISIHDEGRPLFGWPTR